MTSKIGNKYSFNGKKLRKKNKEYWLFKKKKSKIDKFNSYKRKKNSKKCKKMKESKCIHKP